MDRATTEQRGVTDVAVDGHPLVLVEDTSTEGQDGQPQTIRGWAREATSGVEVTTMTTAAPVSTAALVQEAALGFVMLRGMAQGTARDELTVEVRRAASTIPEERPDVVDVDGVPARAVVLEVDGSTVAGLVDGATTVVVTAAGTGRAQVRLSA